MTTTAQPMTTDTTFQWTLRLVGMTVIVLSGFFLVKNIGFGMMDDVLLFACMGLGAITCVAGWLPER